MPNFTGNVSDKNPRGRISDRSPRCGGVADRKVTASISSGVVPQPGNNFRLTEEGDMRVYEDSSEMILD